MAGLTIKSTGSPEEVRPFVAHGRADVVDLNGHPVIYGTFEPGWRWSEHLQPIAKTDSCQAPHLLYCVSGRMGIRMDDGTEGEIGPGDVVSIAPGHDAWTIGDEPCIAVDFGGFAQYAKG
jgi:quercetin dioxygenase-like cupin family protein